ncbi:MAG: hypothetical protein KA354_04145 [Phycisphaerae bacterium]|nr:hypothetical protein [Phycisphaerae bacterium]
MGQGIIANTTIAFQPPGELLDGPQVMLAGLQALSYLVVLADGCLDCRGGQVACPIGFHLRHQRFDMPRDVLDLLLRYPLRSKVRAPIRDMLGKRSAFGYRVSVGAGINNAVTPQRGIGNAFGQDALSRRAIRRAGRP